MKGAMLQREMQITSGKSPRAPNNKKKMCPSLGLLTPLDSSAVIKRSVFLFMKFKTVPNLQKSEVLFPSSSPLFVVVVK